MEDNPTDIIIAGLIEALWSTLGEGSFPIWRQVANRFYETIEANGGDMSTYESSLDSIKDYYKSHGTLSEMTYEIKDGEATIKVTGCGFMPIVDEMDEKNIDEEHSCPFFNTSLVAIENISGNMYDWKREKQEYGTCSAHIKKI
ncbi:hypothetical protein [Methanobacterium sp.]|jgi:hypothetical protein|uniref:hypothetical protein n=1 Tax=Methanobacterium sp. TaxID=2164 RepID=UPI003158F599